MNETEPPHRPRAKRLRRFLIIIAIIFIALGALYTTYYLTRNWAEPELRRVKTVNRSLRAETRALLDRVESSESRLKSAEHEVRVMRQANQLLREEETVRQAELNRLQGELEFYQRLAGTSGTQSGLAVYHLELSPTGSARVFHFVLTLTQNLRRSAISSGNVRVDLEGTLDDRPLTLPWSQITDGSQPEPAFRFKYFQQIQGYLMLPERFQPARLQVLLEAKGQSRPVTRSFSWEELMADAGAEKAFRNPGSDPELERELGAGEGPTQR